jgi:hypothetical protein
MFFPPRLQVDHRGAFAKAGCVRGGEPGICNQPVLLKGRGAWMMDAGEAGASHISSSFILCRLTDISFHLSPLVLDGLSEKRGSMYVSSSIQTGDSSLVCLANLNLWLVLFSLSDGVPLRGQKNAPKAGSNV